MRTGSVMKWFDPVVSKEDEFVRPDFRLGQFFYSARTAEALVRLFDGYRHPCCLCTPRLAWEWHRRGRTVRLLDCDRRFATLPGFRAFDLLCPEPIGEEFDVVIVDPIFIPGRQLRRAVDLVVGPERIGRTDLFVTFPTEREAELVSSFAPYGLSRVSVGLQHNNILALSAGT
jgi:hypothetical protein